MLSPLFGGRGGRAEHRAARGLGQQAVVIQRRIPAGQVVQRGIDAAIAEYGAGGALVGALPAAIEPAVAIGTRGDRVDTVLVGHGMGHAQRAEDALLQEGCEILARGASGDHSTGLRARAGPARRHRAPAAGRPGPSGLRSRAGRWYATAAGGW
ncbi:hypothetical protein G6F58_012858 [Rhizopus delemar]|nr:hypothetical protein G6F58_012858 [Rhizopus delemar]